MLEPHLLLRIAAGGAAGSMARHGLLELAGDSAAEPMLLAINGIGSLLIGLLIGRSIDDRQRALLATGFCGGFTSFSTFAVSVAQSLDDGGAAVASRSIASTLIITVIAVIVGLTISRSHTSSPSERRAT